MIRKSLLMPHGLATTREDPLQPIRGDQNQWVMPMALPRRAMDD